MSVGAYAQNITVKGTVTDATGEPVIGANVLEKGTTNGVITDIDGNFQLQTSRGAILQAVPFVGFLTAEVKAAPNVNVILQEDSQLLSDVVVIGYATGSQRTISGAVQKVGREEMNAGVVVNPLAAIKGKIAGVNIQKTGGDPTAAPAIRVRGTTSLTGGNDPLVIIDGVFGDLNMLNAISPADIENFTVLKDASETAQVRVSRGASAMDFDDLLVYTYILFRDFPEVLARYRDQFRYVLVDEYQDTNYAQHSIVLQLTKENQRVCVVGDDAQSIYSFRGADIDNILYFTKIYPNTKVFKLEQNYRSTQTIVCAANSLIEKNERQIRKAVFSEKEKGEPIGVFQAYSDVEEGDIVANKIAELRREYRYGYADFAILYRTNAQSRIFEEALRKRSMPYKIYGGLSFYQRKEIKDVIAYFRLVVNPNDEEAFKRIINYPARGIGDTTVGKIISAATESWRKSLGGTLRTIELRTGYK